MSTITDVQRSAGAQTTHGGRYLALTLATLGFAVNFWAWSLLSPLAPKYKDLLSLSPLAVSVMVAVPVIVGSLGRIPLGALTDRFGGRLMFALVSYATIVPVLFLALPVSRNYGSLLAGGLLLGLGGATFAIGIPFVNAWFPPARRGFALGVYGMGNIGTAVANFVSPRVWTSATTWSAVPFVIVAVALAVMGTLFLLVGRNAPGTAAGSVPFMVRFRAAWALRVTKELAALYAITFGGFVSFGVYLPTYLKTAYHLSATSAATRAAGFVVVATVARPLGGWLADRYGGRFVLHITLGIVALCAIVVAFTPVMAVLTIAMLTMAAMLGCGNGAVFALVGKLVPVEQVGTVTGVVGAAGGLGGFLPPIVMGLVYTATSSYGIGLMLLSDVALAGLVFTIYGLASGRAHPARG